MREGEEDEYTNNAGGDGIQSPPCIVAGSTGLLCNNPLLKMFQGLRKDSHNASFVSHFFPNRPKILGSSPNVGPLPLIQTLARGGMGPQPIPTIAEWVVWTASLLDQGRPFSEPLVVEPTSAIP